jgi:hypothetical protein
VSQASALVAQLAAAGTDPELLARVAEALFAGELGMKAIEERRRHERERKARSRDVTGQGVTDADPSLDKKRPHTPSKTKPNQVPPIIPQTLEAWNGMAARYGLPQVEKITGKRLKALMARIDEHGFDAVLRAISNVPGSPHWLGGNGWLGNLDSLLRPDNFQRMIEGAYAGKANKPTAIADPDQVRRNRLALAELYEKQGRESEAEELRRQAA